MINLFCFPFVGGDAGAYESLRVHAGDEVNIITLELPGRGARYADPLIDDIQLLAEDCYRQLSGKLSAPFAFFGHSMGALLAYLLTRKLAAMRQPPPAYLFVSGFGGPSVAMTAARRQVAVGEEWKRKMYEVMQVPLSVLNSETFWAVYEPIIRTDLLMFKKYDYEPDVPFNIPISVFIGTEDDVTIAEAGAWQRETGSPVTIHLFSGKHHFWKDHTGEIMTMIRQKLMEIKQH
ncbi:thioesterase [Chitinophaga oryzae]|uniref:Thioesterase n=1 Tax=Chitinophaga oryzae TaxID=2725414 RepID=A0AAE6ZI60_9BACT|nr:alpha/beta fold hydrolase [Chitinophaga oryzae]QJB31879.1 thioesterase [Chitinophaga oryzae]QJB38356.1 thioesterase [Chitinophaga oryzae]